MHQVIHEVVEMILSWAAFYEAEASLGEWGWLCYVLLFVSFGFDIVALAVLYDDWLKYRTCAVPAFFCSDVFSMVSSMRLSTPH